MGRWEYTGSSSFFWIWVLLTIRKGWFVVLSTRFSVKMWATSSFCIIASFFSILIAYRCAVAFSLHKITLPNVPLPKTFKNSKFSNVWKERENIMWVFFLLNPKAAEYPLPVSCETYNFLSSWTFGKRHSLNWKLCTEFVDCGDIKGTVAGTGMTPHLNVCVFDSCKSVCNLPNSSYPTFPKRWTTILILWKAAKNAVIHTFLFQSQREMFVR